MTASQDLAPANDLADCPEAVSLLGRLHNALSEQIAGRRARPIALSPLPRETQTLVLEALGDGAIRAELDEVGSHPRTRLTETRLAGVWHSAQYDAGGRLLESELLTGECPSALSERPFNAGRNRILMPPDHSPDTAAAVAVLVELEAQLDALDAAGDDEPTATTRPGRQRQDAGQFNTPYSVDLRMLVDSPAAMDMIERCVGVGPARVANLSYGRCDIQATAVRNVWRLRQFNAAGRLLLDRLDIGRVPAALLATREDLAESLTRLDALLATVRG